MNKVMPSPAAADSRWSAMDESGHRSVGSLGLRRSDKMSIAPKKPMRRNDSDDAMSEPPAFTSSHRKQSLVSPTKKEKAEPIAPPKFVQNKDKSMDESLKRLDLEDITETEFTEDCSESHDADLSNSPTLLGRKAASSTSSVQTAPASIHQYSKPSKDERYANFDSGFGERRESRMRRVQRIKSNERVMPSLESQQRAIANRRRTSDKPDRTQQELESVRSSTRMSIKDRMAMFNGNGSSSDLSSPI